MRRSFYLSTVLTYLLSSNLFGISIGTEGTSSPFIVTYDESLQSSFEPILQVVNNSEVGVLILSWQLELEIRPLSGAQGELSFHSAHAPPSSLFGQEPGPTSDLTSPADHVLAFDADTAEFDGEEVPAHTARNILQLTMIATPNAAGTFQLVMPEFDAENPENGSSWFEADGFQPVAFDNAASSDFPGFVLLGTINVTQPFLPGDYDSDGIVGPLDYARWRNHFRESVSAPGDEADGNRDSIVDAADYVIWRKNFLIGEGSSSRSALETLVPEPETSVFVVAVVVFWFGRELLRSRNGRPTPATIYSSAKPSSPRFPRRPM